jgi:type IV pilus assembly protein PilW
MSRHNSQPLPRRYDATLPRGFGLVELMVSMAIGLVIIAALVALFAGTSRNNREMASANSVIENGRFAIQLLEDDLLHAGYWGTWVPRFDNPTFEDAPGDVPATVPDPCLAYNPNPGEWDAAYYSSLIGIPVQSYEADDATLPCAAVATDRVADSDVLFVRHAEMCVPGVGECEADVAGKIYIQSSLCATPGTTPLVIGPNDADFTLTARNCTALAEKRRFISHIYYVRDYARVAGDGIPTLVRSEFDLAGGVLSHQPPVALIEGVDAMRVEIGIDDTSITGDPVVNAAAIVWVVDPAYPNAKRAAINRGDGIPDGPFVRCTAVTPCTAEQLANATAVRVYVLARSREPTTGYTDTKEYQLGASGSVGPFDDGFKRHVYATTVRLINVSGRRERP